MRLMPNEKPVQYHNANDMPCPLVYISLRIIAVVKLFHPIRQLCIKN
jgi:hypothetical protein